MLSTVKRFFWSFLQFRITFSTAASLQIVGLKIRNNSIKLEPDMMTFFCYDEHWMYV
jgi:hypothetical protein